MAENPRPPVAIRIVRPYDNEDEFLENELVTVGKTSVILIGAHPRPTGVILRFEMNLQSGVTLLRGEGRVLAHKESAFRGQAGLTLRFTRLDPKSKALVDRAAAMREARTSGEIPVSIPPQPKSSDPLPSVQPTTKRSSPAPPANAPVSARPPADPVLADILTSATPEPPPPAPASRPRRNAPHTFVAPEKVEATITREKTEAPPPPQPAAMDTERPPPDAKTEMPAAPATEPPSPPSVPPPAKPAVISFEPGNARKIEPPPDRDALLARLRERAAALTPEKVRAILDAR